jgi:phosphate transport system substrate-binding protein
VLKLIQKIGLQYMNENANVRIPLVGGGTAIGYKSALDGTCDIGMASGPIPSAIQVWAEKNNYALENITIANDGLATIVNLENPIKDLSLEQLHDIFTGKITNWSAFGKPACPITVVSHDPKLGTYDSWKREVLGEDYITLKAKVVGSLSQLSQAMTKDPGAIGYVGTAFLDKLKVKPLLINGFLPTYDNIQGEKYPIRNELQLLVKPNARKEVREFVTYCLEANKGQALIKEIGLVPVKAQS